MRPMPRLYTRRRTANAANRRQAVKTLELTDMVTAATGLVHDLIVVARNVRHFDHIDGMQIENWFPASSQC